MIVLNTPTSKPKIRKYVFTPYIIEHFSIEEIELLSD